MMLLECSKLTLRPFQLSDASEVQRLAGDPAVAATTLTIPHPYPDGAADEWIGKHESWRESGRSFPFAMEEKSSRRLVGCISLEISNEHRRGMLGYWVGKEFWNLGYCTEATKLMIEFGFKDLSLLKINAYHLAINPSSGRVMEKAGMVREGYFKRHVIKAGESRDCIFYGIAREL